MSSDLAKRLAGHKPKLNVSAPLGQGGRFAAMEAKVSNEPGVRDPAALAAAIGRKSVGKKKFQALAVKGRK